MADTYFLLLFAAFVTRFTPYKVKLRLYKKGEKGKPQPDDYDLIALVLDSYMNILDADNSTIPLVQHQPALIPAGRPHAFHSPYSSTKVLFVEVRPEA